MAGKTPRTIIADALADLRQEDWERFCVYLLEKKERGKGRLFRRAQVEKRSRLEVSGVLVDVYPGYKAIEVTDQLLREMGCNRVAEELDENAKELQLWATNNSMDHGASGESASPRQSLNKDCSDKDHSSEAGPSTHKPQNIKKNACNIQKLGLTEFQFGKHKGKSFSWLVENEVGYVGFIVGSHLIEREKGDTRQTTSMTHKDDLAEYVSHFPEAVKEVRLYREGEAPLGFGKYKNMTCKKLYNSYEEKHKKYVKWLLGKAKSSTKDPVMDATIQYILACDGKRSTTSVSQKRTATDTESEPTAKTQKQK